MAYVEINLYDLETDDLVDELQDRGYTVINGNLGDAEEIAELYKDYKTYGYTEKFQKLLEAFFKDLDL